jgi:hypothetical protein
LSRLSSLEVARVAGMSRDTPLAAESTDLPAVVVHKDDLVLMD